MNNKLLNDKNRPTSRNSYMASAASHAASVTSHMAGQASYTASGVGCIASADSRLATRASHVAAGAIYTASLASHIAATASQVAGSNSHVATVTGRLAFLKNYCCCHAFNLTGANIGANRGRQIPRILDFYNFYVGLKFGRKIRNMNYEDFYKEFINLLRIYCSHDGNSQKQTAGNMDMKAQELNDIINKSEGMNTRTQFDLYREMGVDHADILKLLEAGIEKRREELKKKRRGNI